MAKTPIDFGAPRASLGPLLVSVKQDLSTKGEKHIELSQEVNAESAPTQLPEVEWGRIQNAIVNEGNTTRARWRATDVELDENDEFRQFVTDVGKPEDFYCGLTKTEQIVPSGTAATAPTFDNRIISDTIEDIDGTHAKQVTITADAYQSQTGKFYHPELQLVVTQTRELIDKNDALPALVAGTEVTIEPIDCVKSLKVTRSIAGWEAEFPVTVPPGTYKRELRTTTNYTYPAYLDPAAAGHVAGFDADLVFLSQRRRTAYILNSARVDSKTKRVHGTLTIEFYDGTKAITDASFVPGASTLYNPETTSLRYNGLLFKVNEPSVLVDAGSIVANTGTGKDTYYGDSIGETFEWGATSPTATAFKADVAAGTEVLIDEQLKPWAFTLWRREQLRINL